MAVTGRSIEYLTEGSKAFFAEIFWPFGGLTHCRGIPVLQTNRTRQVQNAGRKENRRTDSQQLKIKRL
jgi:hypothetical protein